MLSTAVTDVTVPLVAVKLLVLTVPTTASSKVTVNVMALLAVPLVASVTVLTTGALVSMACASKLAKLALTTALPAASLSPAPTRLSVTLPEATPAVGVTTTV